MFPKAVLRFLEDLPFPQPFNTPLLYFPGALRNNATDSNATSFLGAFEKLRKATIRFVTSDLPSFLPHVANRIPLDGFSLNFIYYYF
jgi:hypothetical protein